MHSLEQVRKRLAARQNNPCGEKPVTIVCFGDSVTHGVFEVRESLGDTLELTYDAEAVYHARLKELLDFFYPAAAVSIINSGVSGDTAAGGLARIERDVLAFFPDLCIVCFGLNDSLSDMQGLTDFQSALSKMLDRLDGIPVVLLTPCMINTKVSNEISGETLTVAAKQCMEVQNNGVLAAYVEAIREQANMRDIPVCDEYARYERWAASGIDTNRLLANRINHPLREIHSLWAQDLFILLVG